MKTLLEGISQTRLSRRTALKTMGAAAATLAMPGLVRASGGTIKLGFISPLTGPLSPFGESDGYTVEIIKACWQTASRITARPTRSRSWCATPSPIRTNRPNSLVN